MLGAAAGAGALLGSCRSRAPLDPNAELAEGMLEPDKTGSLSAAEMATMWTLFSFIGKRWENSEYNLLDRDGLTSLVGLKTRETPSYLSEYRLTHQLYEDYVQKYGRERAAEEIFNLPVDAPPTTVAGHIRQYTLSELINLQVAYGGFRKLGYVNYPGYAGGSYDDPGNLPYRKA